MTRWISAEGYAKLREEWQELYKQVRPKLLEEIAAAAAQGDRSENAEYIYGRKKLREIDARLRDIDRILDRVSVIDPAQQNPDKIGIGATIRLQKENGSQWEVKIVGPDEIDPLKGFISPDSPIGLALLGHPTTGEINVSTPRGLQRHTIVSVSYS